MEGSKSLPLVHRETFFDDDFFKEAWGDFDRAVQQVLDKFDSRGLKIDTGARNTTTDLYRSIRTNKINDDLYASQALQVTEKDGKFQMVMDVKDFNPKDLQVRAVDDHIVVEGSYEKASEDGSNKSAKSFYKEFTLPSAADIDKVSTALSKDGVLSIKAPKKEGFEVLVEGPKISSSTSVQESSSVQHSNDGTSATSFKSNTSKTVMQSSSSFESSSGELFENLPTEMKNRLLLSNLSLGSPKSSTCSSPCPSEAASDSSRVSTSMQFDVGNKAGGTQRSEVTFNVASGAAAPVKPSPPVFQGLGSGKSTSVNVTEENGKRVYTSDTSNMVQDKDGFMKHHEIAEEITGKDTQSARREASTVMSKQEEDPEGRFKRAEAADAKEMNESCIQTLPDGTVKSMKKSSSTTSSIKQSFSSTAGDGPSLFHGPASDDYGKFMVRGPLMANLSTDSMASTLSGFSDMSNFSTFTGASRFSDMSNFSNFSNFTNPSSISQLPDIGNFNNIVQDSSSSTSRVVKSFSSSTSNVSKSNFSSSFGDMDF